MFSLFLLLWSELTKKKRKSEDETTRVRIKQRESYIGGKRPEKKVQNRRARMHAELSSLVDRLPALSEHTGKQSRRRTAMCCVSVLFPSLSIRKFHCPGSFFFFFESNSQLALCVCACIHLHDRMIVFFLSLPSLLVRSRA